MPATHPPPEPLTRDRWIAAFAAAALEIWPEAGSDYARKVARLRYHEWKLLEPRAAVDRWRAQGSAGARP